jgi:multidrug efflux pump subunit AcrB
LVTIASFVPIGFAEGAASEFLISLFSVVAISLIVSWLVAVIFAPIMGKFILKAPEPGASTEEKPSKLLDGFNRLLRGALAAKWLTIGLTIGAFAFSLFALQFVPKQFFPASDRPELLVDLTLRQNASIQASAATTERVEALLRNNPDVGHFSSYVGRGAIRFYLPLSVQLANPFVSQIVIVAKDIAARDRLQLSLEKTLAVQFPDVVSRVAPLEMGPPVGWPLQYRVSGPDKEKVSKIALQFATVLGGDTRTRNINFDWMEPARQVRVHINQDEAQRGDDRHDDYPGARRYLPRQRHGPRHRQRPRLARHAEFAAGADGERSHGAAATVRDVHRRAGVPAGLAPRPCADTDGAR